MFERRVASPSSAALWVGGVRAGEAGLVEGSVDAIEKEGYFFSAMARTLAISSERAFFFRLYL
jgi:hypothetical protein